MIPISSAASSASARSFSGRSPVTPARIIRRVSSGTTSSRRYTNGIGFPSQTRGHAHHSVGAVRAGPALPRPTLPSSRGRNPHSDAAGAAMVARIRELPGHAGRRRRGAGTSSGRDPPAEPGRPPPHPATEGVAAVRRMCNKRSGRRGWLVLALLAGAVSVGGLVRRSGGHPSRVFPPPRGRPVGTCVHPSRRGGGPARLRAADGGARWYIRRGRGCPGPRRGCGRHRANPTGAGGLAAGAPALAAPPVSVSAGRGRGAVASGRARPGRRGRSGPARRRWCARSRRAGWRCWRRLRSW